MKASVGASNLEIPNIDVGPIKPTKFLKILNIFRTKNFNVDYYYFVTVFKLVYIIIENMFF